MKEEDRYDQTKHSDYPTASPSLWAEESKQSRNPSFSFFDGREIPTTAETNYEYRLSSDGNWLNLMKALIENRESEILSRKLTQKGIKKDKVDELVLVAKFYGFDLEAIKERYRSQSGLYERPPVSPDELGEQIELYREVHNEEIAIATRFKEDIRARLDYQERLALNSYALELTPQHLLARIPGYAYFPPVNTEDVQHKR